jgi:hypothetical protein
MYSKLTTRSAPTNRLGRFTTLLLLAAATALSACGDNDSPTAAPVPEVPDLRFEPSTLTIPPGDSASTTVRVEPAADLRGATFTLDGSAAGMTTRFTAAADGKSGRLWLVASPKAARIAWTVTVKGRRADGAKTWVGNLALNVSPTAARMSP